MPSTIGLNESILSKEMYSLHFYWSSKARGEDVTLTEHTTYYLASTYTYKLESNNEWLNPHDPAYSNYAQWSRTSP